MQMRPTVVWTCSVRDIGIEHMWRVERWGKIINLREKPVQYMKYRYSIMCLDLIFPQCILWRYQINTNYGEKYKHHYHEVMRSNREEEKIF